MSKIKKWKILIGLWIGIGSCVQSMEAKGGSKKISKFFTYNEKKELETKIHSSDFVCRNLREKDIPFAQKLFANKDVMKFYADGRPRDPNKVKQRCADLIKRAEDGHPNGAIIVSTTDENGQEEPFAWFIAGGGSAPGVSEIACLMTLEKQQEGWGTKLIPTVKEYTDEIRRIGHGVDLKETEKWIQEKFSCFQGKPLEKLEATTSPLNEPSWKLLKSLGFYAKPIETEKKIEVNYKGQTLNKMVHGLTDLFNREENPLSKGELYSMIDHNSEKRTVSFHETWNIVKWHVEKNLGEQ